jgi:mannose-6-phosphate isomerase-like protein (cupin superfamily)
MKITLEEIEGDIVKDNETYLIKDNTFLNHLTISTTFLHPKERTNGHSHKNQEEVYIFTYGDGIMIIGEDEFEATEGDVFLIPQDTFHQVININPLNPCLFTCVFEKYDRDSNVAEYN